MEIISYTLPGFQKDFGNPVIKKCHRKDGSEFSILSFGEGADKVVVSLPHPEAVSYNRLIALIGGENFTFKSLKGNMSSLQILEGSKQTGEICYTLVPRQDVEEGSFID